MSPAVHKKPDKKESLRRIIRCLCRGAKPEAIKPSYAAMIRDIPPAELMHLQGELLRERMIPKAGLLMLSGLHLDIVHESFMKKRGNPALPSGEG